MSQQQHFILRVGDGLHFKSSSSRHIWGINSKTPFGKWFVKTARKGDLLWFVQSKTNGKLIAVATFVGNKDRVLGPLLALTPTNEELGWTKQKGKWDTELHYENLYNLSECELYSEIKGASTIRLYSDKCKVNLPNEYPYIVRYSKVATKF
jgi:hypothetical protein